METARLRTGHSTILVAYRRRIGLPDTPTCPECGGKPETVAHLLTDCPARADLRRRVFGRDNPTLQDALGDRARLGEGRKYYIYIYYAIFCHLGVAVLSEGVYCTKAQQRRNTNFEELCIDAAVLS